MDSLRKKSRFNNPYTYIGVLLVLSPLLVFGLPSYSGFEVLGIAAVAFVVLLPAGLITVLVGLIPSQGSLQKGIKIGLTVFLLAAVITVSVWGVSDYLSNSSPVPSPYRNQSEVVAPRVDMAKPASTSQTISNNLIIKKDWGVSFVKNASYEVVRTFPRTNFESSPNALYLYEPNNEERITIDYISGGTAITTADSKFGYTTIRFDEKSQRWTKETTENGNVTIVPAQESFYTPDNLPVFITSGRWLTYVVPLSHTTFIQLNITGSGVTQPLTDLVKTLRKLM